MAPIVKVLASPAIGTALTLFVFGAVECHGETA